MAKLLSKLFFDQQDHTLLGIVNDVLSRDRSARFTKRSIYPYLHPHGIKELAESTGIRIAYAVINLLESLEADEVDDRLSALRALRNEIVNTAEGPMPRNTARVLLQIMKELVRAYGDYDTQLRLAHDFRLAATGKPRIIRQELRRYHLLEMPEEWNQLTFDDHVHDANTKGRKSSSHLIMDAWIKGVRRLKIIYYNYLEPKFAVELFEAAKIVGIDLRVGIEFSTRFRDKFAQIIWTPRGFADAESFLCFLAESDVTEFMAKGKEVSDFQKAYVLKILHEFNDRHRHDLGKKIGIRVKPFEETDFISFVGTGQASITHLAEFICAGLGQVGEKSLLNPDMIKEAYLDPEKNRSIPDPNIPTDNPDAPSLLQLMPGEMIERLSSLNSSYRITLNLSNLRVEDVLEILYDCEGKITRLELFNLKDYSIGKIDHIPDINNLQLALNKGSIIELKRITADIISRLEESGDKAGNERLEALRNILHDISAMRDSYRGIVIKTRMGSDSTGRSPNVHGMGLAVLETLPVRAKREIKKASGISHDIIPVHMTALPRITYVPSIVRVGNAASYVIKILSSLPGLSGLERRARKDWIIQDVSVSLKFTDPPVLMNPVRDTENIVTLGGISRLKNNECPPEPGGKEKNRSVRYLNTTFKSSLKVFIGFVPAFTTFMLTKDWWLLAYFGAFIWFGITGFRNILQSVFGGGGIRRSPLLRWNDYVQWERISESLLFTGFSVPLLDFLVKTVLLEQGLGITTGTNPILLYSVMAFVNGAYLSSHNAFRGFPKAVIFGNFFRSVLSIPVAVAINILTAGILTGAGITGVDHILQKWAAIISKAASDCVAGLIEGVSDRAVNIGKRWRDYKNKLAQLFETYAQFEILFPEARIQELLNNPERIAELPGEEVRDLQKIMVINGLDLLYFRMYQPRSVDALKGRLKELSNEDRRIFLSSQMILKMQKDITVLFANGLIGKNFSRALAFYLDHSKDYLRAMEKLVLRMDSGSDTI